MHAVALPRGQQLYHVFLPAILGKFTVTACCLTTTYVHHQHARESIHKPVHDLLQPPGLRSASPAPAHNGMDVAVVKLDKLINWSRKVSSLVQGSVV